MLQKIIISGIVEDEKLTEEQIEELYDAVSDFLNNVSIKVIDSIQKGGKDEVN